MFYPVNIQHQCKTGMGCNASKVYPKINTPNAVPTCVVVTLAP